MKINILKLDSEKYDEGTFNKIKIVLDKMELHAVNKEYTEAIAFGSDALERLKAEPDANEIYNIINTAISAVTLEGMRTTK